MCGFVGCVGETRSEGAGYLGHQWVEGRLVPGTFRNDVAEVENPGI